MDVIFVFFWTDWYCIFLCFVGTVKKLCTFCVGKNCWRYQ